jgi:alpha/beta superfamily hydrolase
MQLLMRRPEINNFISVSPPANTRDFSFLAPCPSTGLIVHGDKDTITSFDSTKILSEKLQKQKKVNIHFKSIKGADHFYENFTDQFSSTIDNYIKDSLANLK